MIKELEAIKWRKKEIWRGEGDIKGILENDKLLFFDKELNKNFMSLISTSTGNRYTIWPLRSAIQLICNQQKNGKAALFG